MIANAVLISTIIFVALICFLSGHLRFLTPWRDLLLREYWHGIAVYCGLLFLNLLGAVVYIQRQFQLKDAGQKLAHFDKQIHSGAHELSGEIGRFLEDADE